MLSLYVSRSWRCAFVSSRATVLYLYTQVPIPNDQTALDIIKDYVIAHQTSLLQTISRHPYALCLISPSEPLH